MGSVIGLVGSPRKQQGYTHRLVRAVLDGAEALGARTRLEHLADWDLEACTACGRPCFSAGTCQISAAAAELTDVVNEHDALVIGAPVYVWQVNALTHAFMDRYRLPDNASLGRKPNGRAAVPVIVAGGTGTGVFGATRSMLDFLCLWSYRSLEPVLATRYNLEAAIETARGRGAELARAAEVSRPFSGVAELISYYDALRYGNLGRVDEMLWLARQARHLGYSHGGQIEALIEEAEAAIAADPPTAAAKAVQAFELARGPL